MQNEKVSKDVVVLYHANCTDGFGGAWVARKKFGDSADYIPVKHHDPVPPETKGKEVYIIDFAYPEEETRKLLEDAKSLTVIDHHVTMKDVVLGVPSHMFDIDHSGAVLAWHYFFPDDDVPLFLRYVEDGDLWKFELPDSKKFYSFSLTLPFEFSEWDEVVEEFEDENKRKKYMDYGANILEYQEKIIAELMGNAEEVTFEGHPALAVNSSMLESQLGNAIVKKGYDIGIVWSHLNGDNVRVSLRSGGENDVDVGEIAKKYGGGGHKSASGFVVKEGEDFPWKSN